MVSWPTHRSGAPKGSIVLQQSGALGIQAFRPGLKSYVLTNDDSTTDLVVLLDGRGFTLEPGDVLDDQATIPEETVLDTFEVVSGAAWRFRGRY